jgi:TonB family protein
MTILVSIVVGVLANAAILAGGATSGAQPASPVTTQPTTSLCAALQSVDRGQSLPVVVSGIYAVSSERQVLNDPTQPSCEEDVQPSTWVEFAAGAENTALLTKLLQEDHRAYVTFEGILAGPGALAPDTPKLPDKWSASDRMRGTRYGHQNAFRTQLVVTRVDAASRVPAATPWNMVYFPPDLTQREMQLLRSDLPSYPFGARLAGLEGEVKVEVTLQAGRVAAARVIAGDRALAAAAVSNIKTWTFSPEVEGKFVTRFLYVLAKQFGKQSSQTIELDVPSLVRITAPRNGW